MVAGQHGQTGACQGSGAGRRHGTTQRKLAGGVPDLGGACVGAGGGAYVGVQSGGGQPGVLCGLDVAGGGLGATRGFFGGGGPGAGGGGGGFGGGGGCF